MGRSTDSEVCRNVANLGDFDGLLNYDNNGQNATKFDPSGSEEILELPHRWKALPGTHQYGRLFVDTYQKTINKGEKTDTLEVHIVNTAEYANGGEKFYVVFSDRAKAVRRFLKDFNISEKDAELMKRDVVHQTL